MLADSVVPISLISQLMPITNKSFLNEEKTERLYQLSTTFQVNV